MGMGFQFEQHRLGLWDLSWDLKKTISWEMGLGPPLHDPLHTKSAINLTKTPFQLHNILSYAGSEITFIRQARTGD